MNVQTRRVPTGLYFITDTDLCAQAGRSVPATVAAAVQGGAKLVQIRDKHLSDADVYALARAVFDVVPAASPNKAIPVFINDRVDVVARLRQENYPAHIHIGQGDMPVAEVRRRLGPQPLLGLSVSNAADMAVAHANDTIDLLGIGPAFATATKADAGAALGPAGVVELVAATDLPAFAIGGIHAANAAQLRATGVAGICVVSAICTAADVVAQTRALIAAFNGDDDANRQA